MFFFFPQKMMFIEPLAIFDIKNLIDKKYWPILRTGGYLSTAVACFIEQSILKFIFVSSKMFPASFNCWFLFSVLSTGLAAGAYAQG